MVPASVVRHDVKSKKKKNVLPERFELSISRLLSERLSQLGHGSSIANWPEPMRDVNRNWQNAGFVGLYRRTDANILLGSVFEAV